MAVALSMAQAPPPKRATSAAAVAASAPVVAPLAPLPLSADELLGYIHRVLDWYHHVTQIAQLSGAADDAVTRDRLQAQARAVLRLAFELGRAAAPLVSAGTGAGPRGASTSVLGQLQQAGSNLAQREATLQVQLADVEVQVKKLRGEPRQILQAHRDNLAASLKLVHEGQASMQQMVEFAQRAATLGGEPQGTLTGRIAELERTLPQTSALVPAAVAGGAAPAAVPAAHFRPEAAGIIALVSQAFSLRGTQSEMSSLRKETDALLAELTRLRAAVGRQAREVMQASIAVTQQTDAATNPAQRQEIEVGTARFRQLTSVVVPLSEQVLLLTSTRETLQELGRSVDQRLVSVMRYFALKLGVLLASVAAVLVASDLWRRATLRYVHDPARRRPLLVLRRLVVGLALVVVIAFGLAAEVGSLTTFMGFLTAGIAVTLQNVILSVVAYFFLIGRYGVQVGDRITLAGVTGRVIDVSLLRLYVLELAGTDLHSTGRLVVISNAVLFQPQALYKQIPGADYLWHTVTVTIAPGADIEAASKSLTRAAEAVFGEYREVIERQHALMQQHLDFETGLPRPQLGVEVAADGVHCSVRYPVPPQGAAAIDQQMLESLQAAIQSDGQMQLLSTGAVKLTADS
jgi:small-conductance mechanosensitive channel